MQQPFYQAFDWRSHTHLFRVLSFAGGAIVFLAICLLPWIHFGRKSNEEETRGNYQRISALSGRGTVVEEPHYADDFAQIDEITPEDSSDETDIKVAIADDSGPLAGINDTVQKSETKKSSSSKKSKSQNSLLAELLADAAEFAQLTDAPIDYLIRIAALQDRVRDKAGARNSLDWAAENVFEMAEVTEVSENLARVSAAQARYGSLVEAEALSEFIPLAEDKSKALSELSKNQARRKAIPSAKDTALEITDDRRRADTLIWIAMQQAVLKDFDGAMETARGITGNMSSVALEKVAVGMARAKGMNEARRAVQLITTPGAKADALAEVAGMSARMGNLDTANQLGWMIPSYFTQEKSRAWARISDAQVRNREYTQAMLTARLIDHPVMRETALENIVINQSRAGDFLGARSTIDDMKNEATRNNSLKRLAQAQAVFMDPYGARRSIAEIRDPAVKEEALSTVAKTQVRVGDFRGAERTAELIILADERASTLADIARYQARAGEYNGANVNLIEAYSVALTVPSVKQQSQLFVEIAAAQAEAGQLTAAFNIANSIEDPKMQTKALDAVARSQAVSGDVPGALITAMNIENTRTRESTLLGIATTMGEEIAVEDARSTLNQFKVPEQKVRFILTLAQRLLPKKTSNPLGFAPSANREFWRKLTSQTG